MPHADPDARKAIGAAAGRRSGEVRRAKSAQGATKPRGKQRPLETIEDYYQHLGRPTNWGDAVRATELRAAIAKTDAAVAQAEASRIEAQLKTERYVEKVQLEAMANLIRDTWWSEAQQLPGLMLQALADLPIDVRAKVKAAAVDGVAKMAGRVKAVLLQKAQVKG